MISRTATVACLCTTQQPHTSSLLSLIWNFCSSMAFSAALQALQSYLARGHNPCMPVAVVNGTAAREAYVTR